MLTRRESFAGAAALGLGGLTGHALGQPERTARNDAATKLVVLWSSADPDVAHRVALMYTHASKQLGWWEEVELILWGPSQRTYAGDKDLQAKVQEMINDGISVRACVACANSFGLVDRLKELGLPVLGMGGPLTEFLKDPNVAVITF